MQVIKEIFPVTLVLFSVIDILGSLPVIESRLGAAGLSVLRKVFGIVLLSIAVKIIRTNLLVG
jgi:multiple antibiotic resistance protein